MEMAARLTNKQPRLTRYAVRVFGRQYDYDTRRAQRIGFKPSVDLRRGIRDCLAGTVFGTSVSGRGKTA
jgi:nucleoside-diphosphate-sugar epimerase